MELLKATDIFFTIGKRVQNSALAFACEYLTKFGNDSQENPFAVLSSGDKDIRKKRYELYAKAITALHNAENNRRQIQGQPPLRAEPVDGQTVSLFLYAAGNYYEQLRTLAPEKVFAILDCYHATKSEQATVAFAQTLKKDLYEPVIIQL